MRQLSEEELKSVQKAIIAKEITVLELLAEIYDHYISHLERFPEAEFSSELLKLEEKWTLPYCHRLKFEFNKGINKSIRNLQWRLIKSYFTWPRFLFTIILTGSLIVIGNFISPKTYLIVIILPIIILLVGFNFYILYLGRKKYKDLKTIFNFKTTGLWITSEMTNQYGLLAILPLPFYSFTVLIPKTFDISGLYNNPLYIAIIIIFSFFLSLHALTSLESWKIKSKTALI